MPPSKDVYFFKNRRPYVPSRTYSKGMKTSDFFFLGKIREAFKICNYLFLQPNTDSIASSDDMDGSSFSSFYSSFIKTTDGSDSPQENDKDGKHRKYKVCLR